MIIKRAFAACALLTLLLGKLAHADVDNNVWFILHKKSECSGSNACNFWFEMHLVNENPYFELKAENTFSGDNDVIEVSEKQFRFNSEQMKSPGKRHLATETFYKYVKSAFTNQIKSDETGSQINIVIDMFKPENAFTKPYHALYQQVKTLCLAHNITLKAEPQQLLPIQQPITFWSQVRTFFGYQ